MKPARIIVVEDERIVALHLKEMLLRLHYDVVAVAASGQVALENIIQLRPDVVLMDIHVDGQLDGVETTSRIPAELAIPVIYLTAHSDQATMDRALATRPYAYLTKPCSDQELHATIQGAVGRTLAPSGKFGPSGGGAPTGRLETPSVKLVLEALRGAAEEGSQRPTTILLIEDDARFRSVIARALIEAGYQVSEAADGVDGLKRHAAEAPDIVVTDIIMPRQDGIATILAIRASSPETAIIAISGGGSAEAGLYLGFAEDLGVNATLAKPFRPAELIELIDGLLRAKGSAQNPRLRSST